MRRLVMVVVALVVGCGGEKPQTRWGWAQPAGVGAVSNPALVVRPEVDVDGGAAPPPRFTKIVVGVQHTCALGKRADVYCWGRVGQSGDESEVGHDTYEPRRIDGLSDIVDLDIAEASTCFLRRDGEVLCRFVEWPYPTFGEEPPMEWASVGNVPHAISIAVSGHAVCALDGAGSVSCAGPGERLTELTSLAHVARIHGSRGAYSQSFCFITGDLHVSCFGEGNPAASGAPSPSRMPVPVRKELDRAPSEIPGLAGVEQLGWWDEDVCGRRSDGTFVCRGRTKAVDEKKLAAVGAGATLLSGPGPHCAVSRDSLLHCWNGDGTTKRNVDLDVEVLAPEAVGTVSAAAVGDRHACVLRADGQAACWGGTHLGATGTGVLLSRHVPVRVNLPDAAQVTASYDDSCARLVDGSVWCWGFSLEPRKGTSGPACEAAVDNRELRCPSPIEVLGPGSAAEIEGTEPLCVRARVGGAFRCHDGRPRVFHELTGIPGGSANIVTLTPHHYGQFARTAQGRLFTARDFTVGSEKGPTLPQLGPLPWAAKGSWKRVSPDGRCGIDEHDRVQCACAEDGFGNRAASCGPKDVTFTLSALAGARELIHLPNQDVCALFGDGRVSCARERPMPQDLLTGRVVPPADTSAIAALSGVVALRQSAMFEGGGVSRGDVHLNWGGTACAITQDGAVYCWGASARGEVGNPARPPGTAAPTRIEGLPPVTDVALGQRHACALTRANQVFCWGDDEKGQLGQGTPARITQPTPVKL